ncbi:MAG: FKBP-type peptidyl-prolyl cis-trans isomerase [Candidatus Nitrotoga sp.]|nr:FKBP-type peptidyl-prolyl cis-trans isomerase [Candidatus Nitrotoga sp.]MBP0117132.1 FKBP-type peptidyl-prolyl cis-trans isomerase [Candidatus Nitrotoga sp.]MBP0123046.1 FKBP-type peptidyl-prolyl cis-trans isomerase [Candidatus Nitrotoga sp.]MBP0126094.1 FKBP-type peptidyl-prolyl cis-trans isomerase [Candidatus Nitrotoga sp.]
MKILKNTVVSLRYELFDASGDLLEKTENPISYLHGGYDGIFPTVEESLQGKSVGEKIKITMEPDNAFGEYEHDLVRVEPRNLFPDNIAIGMQFEGGIEDGGDDDYSLYTVVEVADTEVTVDGNHPLAGKTLDFVGVVTAVRTATTEELEHGHPHGEGGHHH